MRTFRVTVAKIGENLFDGEAVSASLPGKEGAFQVLAGHEPFVSELSPGVVRVTSEEGAQEFEIKGGVAEISSDQATILL